MAEQAKNDSTTGDAAATAEATAAAEGGEAGATGAAEAVTTTPAKTMRCVTLQGFGGLKMLSVQLREPVQPKEDELLIRVKSCGLNFTDLMVRQGVIDNPPKTPFILGFECSGVVETLGAAVENFAVGDRVLAFTDFGAWSELVAVQSRFVYKMPPSMSFEDGAAMLMSYVTAYILLFDIGNLRQGQSVLVHSAGGGVGTALCQLSRTVDEVTIYGTASSVKHEALQSKVDHLYDHDVDYTHEIRKISSGVDLVLDCLCAEDTNKGISILNPLGRYVLYGSANVVTGETKSFFSFAKSWWQVDKISPIKLYDENKAIAGFHLRQLLFQQKRHVHVRRVVERLFALYDQQKISPRVHGTWPFEQVADAMQEMHDRKNIGKILLDPTMEPQKSQPPSDQPAQQSDDKTPLEQ